MIAYSLYTYGLERMTTLDPYELMTRILVKALQDSTFEQQLRKAWHEKPSFRERLMEDSVSALEQELGPSMVAEVRTVDLSSVRYEHTP